MTITQEITPLPPAPQRTDAPADFVTKADAHVASLDQFVTELNTATDQINDTQDEINTSEANAATSEANAAASASVAQSNANFKGEWSAQTGAANKPYSVSHKGATWLLLNDLADVTLSEPGITSDWFNSDSTRRITHNRFLHFYRNR